MPIERHSLLSDQRTAAVVTPDARVVWMCEPRIDSPPLLAELLGGPDAGFFSVRPLEPGGDAAQRYVGDSMVLETSWDAMSVVDYLDCSEGLPTEPAGRSRLVRVLTGTGQALVEFTPFPLAGSHRLKISAGGIEVRNGDTHLVRLRSSPGLEWHIESHGRGDIAWAEVDLSAGPVVLELLCGNGAGDYAPAEPQRRSATITHWRTFLDRLALPRRRPGPLRRLHRAGRADRAPVRGARPRHGPVPGQLPAGLQPSRPDRERSQPDRGSRPLEPFRSTARRPSRSCPGR